MGKFWQLMWRRERHKGRLVLNDAELNDQEGGTSESYSPYFVRAVDDVVLIYLGDTGQLFSFRYSNE